MRALTFCSARDSQDRGLSSATVGLDEHMAFVFSEGIRAANPHLNLVSATPVTAGCRMIKRRA